MRHTFLHLSDLHYRPNRPEGMDLVWHAFCDDLEKQILHFHDPYLVFSGDLVFAGGIETLYSEFAENIGARVSKHFSRDRIICVPGNHDVSQEALESLATLQLGSLAEMTSEAVFNDSVPTLSDIFFLPKFRNYIAAEAEFAGYGACQTTLGGAGWDLTNEMGVYCLNTALCSYAHAPDSKGEPISDKGKLMIDTRALQKWLQETTSTIRILVMHHPIEWLNPWSMSELDTIIANQFHLVFSGHVHQAKARFSSYGHNGQVVVSAPPLFTCKEDLLGYSFVSLDTKTRCVDPPVALHRAATCIRRPSCVIGSCCQCRALLGVSNNAKGVYLACASSSPVVRKTRTGGSARKALHSWDERALSQEIYASFGWRFSTGNGHLIKNS